MQTPSSRWLSLAILCVGVLMIVLDRTIVNVALPSIQADLGFSQSGLAWVVNAYLVAFGGLLLLAGRMGDLLGRRNVFLAGLAVFTVASLICGVSTNQAMLVGACFVQGLGGAATTAVVLGMIVTMFDQPAAQAKAMGVYSFVAAAGGTIGLLLGGVLTQALNWHWIFFVNVPIGLITALLALRLVERDQGLGLARGADGLGAVLVTGALMLGVYTIVDSAKLGSTATTVLALVAVALLAGFLVRQSMAANPLMPLTIFRSPTLSGANAIQALTVAGMISMLFLSSLYLEQVLRFTPLQLGLSFLPAFPDHRRAIAVAGAPAERPLWPTQRAAGRPDAGVRRPGADGPCTRGWPVPDRCPAGHGLHWSGHRDHVPGAGDTGYGRRRAGGLRPGFGSSQHQRPGRRRARPGHSGNHRSGPFGRSAGRRASAG